MTNFFYTPSGNPGSSSPGASSPIRAEFAAISAAFDLFPALTGNSGRAVVVNGAGTALTLTTGKLTLGGDLTFLGSPATTFLPVANTTLTLPSADGTLMTFNGGTMAGILNLVNGSSIPTAVPGTNNTQIASTAFVASAVSSASSGDRAYTDSTVAANATADRAYTDSVVAANTTADRAYADGKFLPLTGGSVAGSLFASGTVQGSFVQAISSTANGWVTLNPGDSDHTGYIGFFQPGSAGTLAGYIGFGNVSSHRIAMVGNQNGFTGWDMTGSLYITGALIVNGDQSGDDFQLWSTAVPPYARTISFTTSGWSLQFNGQNNGLSFWPQTSIGGAPYFNSNGSTGDFTVRGNVIGNNISAPSDERVKRDIEPYTRGLDDLIRLNPVIYSYNGLGGTTDDGTRRVGLGAQASRDIVPECVFPTPRLSAPRWNRDGSVDEWVDPVLPGQLSLDDRPLLFAAINALKTLHARVKHLEERKH